MLNKKTTDAVTKSNDLKSVIGIIYITPLVYIELCSEVNCLLFFSNKIHEVNERAKKC